MTKQDLYAFWQRWAHRNDVVADMDTVYAMARDRIRSYGMREIADEELEEMLTTAESTFRHAGMIAVHELAQDDTGAQREMALFVEAMDNYVYRMSRTLNPNPRMTPYLVV